MRSNLVQVTAGRAISLRLDESFVIARLKQLSSESGDVLLPLLDEAQDVCWCRTKFPEKAQNKKMNISEGGDG